MTEKCIFDDPNNNFKKCGQKAKFATIENQTPSFCEKCKEKAEEKYKIELFNIRKCGKCTCCDKICVFNVPIENLQEDCKQKGIFCRTHADEFEEKHPEYKNKFKNVVDVKCKICNKKTTNIQYSIRKNTNLLPWML